MKFFLTLTAGFLLGADDVAGVLGDDALRLVDAGLPGDVAVRSVATCSPGFHARHEAMSDNGIEYTAWLTSHGGNVRFAHEEAEENYGPDNPIPVDEPFTVDGESLMHPGDPAGSPGNVINCHCIEIAVQKPEEENE